MKKYLLCLLLVIATLFTLASCADEGDYCSEDDVTALISELESALSAENAATAAEIAALKSEYNAKISVLEAADAENAARIAALDGEYADKLAALEAADKANKDAIDALNTEYTEKLAALEAQDKANKDAIDALNTEYTEKLAALEAQDKANKDAIDALDGEYTEKLTALEAADKANKDAIDALVTEYSAKISELEAAADANEAALAELEAEYRASLELLNAKDKEIGDKVDAIEAEYGPKIDALDGEVAANATALDELEKDYNAKIEALTKADGDNTAAIEKVEADYKKAVEDLKKADTAATNSLNSLKSEYEKKIKELADADTENKTAISTLTNNFNTEVSKLTAADKATADALTAHKTAYEAKMKELTAADKATADALTAHKTAYEAKVKELTAADKATADALADHKTAYEAKVKELTAADKATADALTAHKSAYEAKMATLEAEDKKNEDGIEALKSELSTKISEVNAAHAESIEAINSAISSLSSGVATNKNEIAALKEQIKALQDSQFKWDYYTVNFDTDGAGTVESQTVRDGKKAEMPAAPKKEGYIFGGWYYGTEKWVFAGYPVTKDMILKAKWLEHTPGDGYCLVTFNTDGAGTVANQLLVKDGYVVEPEAPTKDGYTFDGWYNGEVKWNFNTMKIAEDVNLTAKWTAIEHTVNFSTGGGSSVPSKTAKHGETVSEPAAPTYTGYDFIGWYNGTAKWNFATDTVNGPLTLTAKWQIKTYTVTYNSDGGSTVAPETVSHGSKATAPTAPTKTGYTFLGWYKGSTKWSFDTAVTESMTLTAKWQIKTYTVTFNSDGGSAVANATVNHGSKATAPTAPTKTGYTFLGWYKGSTKWSFETAVTESITLTAKWQIKTYTVTFNSDGGSTVANAKVNHGATVDEPETKKDMYTLLGWYNGDEKWNFDTDTVTGPLTLTAKWERTVFVVEFDTGTGSSVPSQRVNKGEKVLSPSDPTLDGYYFMGWYDSNGIEWNMSTMTVSEDMTLVARWIAASDYPGNWGETGETPAIPTN